MLRTSKVINNFIHYFYFKGYHNAIFINFLVLSGYRKVITLVFADYHKVNVLVLTGHRNVIILLRKMQN